MDLLLPPRKWHEEAREKYLDAGISPLALGGGIPKAAPIEGGVHLFRGVECRVLGVGAAPFSVPLSPPANLRRANASQLWIVSLDEPAQAAGVSVRFGATVEVDPGVPSLTVGTDRLELPYSPGTYLLLMPIPAPRR